MKCWYFKVFLDSKGVNEINDWLQSMPPSFRAKVDTIIAYLEVQKDMRCKWFKNVKGYKNVYELRFPHNKIQYRPLGCFGPGKDEFTLVFLAEEKGDKFVPKDAPEKAVNRFKLALQDRRYIDDFV